MKIKVIILILSLLLSCTNKESNKKILPAESGKIQVDSAEYNPADDEQTCRN